MRKIILGALALALATAPASASNIGSQTLTDGDLSALKTWRWGVNVASNPKFFDSRSPLDEVMIATLEAEMETRGYIHDEDGDVDFVLLYATLTGQQFVAFRENLGYFRVMSYQVSGRGVFTLQFLEPATEEPLWVSHADAMAIDEKHARKKVEKIVRKMLDLVGKPDKGAPQQ